MALTDKQKLEFYRRREQVRTVILRNVKKKGHIIYGARAVNQQLRKPLEKDTEDYDIFSKHPQKTANVVEKTLDKKFGGNYFKVEPALHKGTWKLESTVTNRGIADYSKPEGKVKTIKRKGILYAHTSHQLKQIKKSLADPKSKFRHDKDKETRQRIKLNAKFGAKKRKSGLGRMSLNSRIKRAGRPLNLRMPTMRGMF